MKKVVALAAILLSIYFFVSSYQKIQPSYFIKISNTEYSFVDFFDSTLSEEQYSGLGSHEKLKSIYHRIKHFLCTPTCEVTIFSFDSVHVDAEVEGVFFQKTDTTTESEIAATRKKLAEEQYFFTHLYKTAIFINDKSIKSTEYKSPLPWIGLTQDGLAVAFVYATNLNEWFRPWLLRFIREYRKYAKIHVFPYTAGIEVETQLQAVYCLTINQSFWDPFFSDTLNTTEISCNERTEMIDFYQQPLAIRLGEVVITNPHSYFEMVQEFQIAYLATKLK